MVTDTKKKELDEAVERIIRNEILCCDSMLVDKLLSIDFIDPDGFTYDDIENMHNWLDPIEEDWTAAKCLDFINQYENITIAEHDDISEWRDHVDETMQENPQEPLEWWRITRYLCEKLRGIGEPVLDNDYGYWWGRTCSGQSIELDGTIQKIAGVS